MNIQQELDFDRIRRAIEYIDENFKKQPSLNEVAAHVNLSPFHFQRMFTEWSGVSPKQFLQYASIEYAKKMLSDSKATPLYDVAYEAGLSGTGRLHDLFIKIEGLTPGEYKHGGEKLAIRYSFAQSLFGKLLIASTPKGICYIAFIDDEEEGISALKQRFFNATLIMGTDEMQQNALAVFAQNTHSSNPITLHIKGTDFQLKVWDALLKIPMGKLVTYGDVAQYISNPDANRAVGTAIGQNPVAFLIPCHRVIRSTGLFGGYMWGPSRKAAMIGWEHARTR